MSHRRWLAVLAAVVLVGIVELVADSELDVAVWSPLNTVLVMLVVGSVAGALAWATVSALERLDRAVVDRNTALESRNATLRAVYDVSLSMSAQTDPDQTISTVVEHLRRLLRIEAAILLLDEPRHGLRLRAASADDGLLLEGAWTTAVPRDLPQPDLLDHFLIQGLQILAAIPVGLGGRQVGQLIAATRHPRQLEGSDLDTLSAFATQVGLALEAARLRDELKELAVQQERERIARDMHDGLAQVLGYVNTKSQAVAHLLDEGRVEEAQKQIDELNAAARSVYVDVREAILNLSTPGAGEGGIAAALQEYATVYGESSKLAIRFRASMDAVRAPLSAAAQAEMFSIAREALTNVRKHARAQRVSIAMNRTDGEVVLRIKDDGVGFDAELLAAGRERWPHFGLAGMRERAESVGGRITWHSSQGGGTEVELHVPVGRSGRTGLAGTKPLHETSSPAPRHQAVRSSGRVA